MSRHHNKYCDNYNLIGFGQLRLLIPNSIQALYIKIGSNEDNELSLSLSGKWVQVQAQQKNESSLSQPKPMEILYKQRHFHSFKDFWLNEELKL